MPTPRKFPGRPKMDERLILMVPAEMKRSLFEIAAQRGRPAADLVREGVTSLIRSAAT